MNAVFYEPTQQHYYFLIYINELGSHLLFEVPPENIYTIIHTPGLDEVSTAVDDLRSEDLSGDEIAQHANVQSFIEILEWQTFHLINDERAIHNLYALKLDNLVSKMARAHSKDMGDNNFFSHTSATHGTFPQRLAAYNIVYYSAGENIAWNNYPESSIAGITVKIWIGSPGHRANILNNNYIYTGIGVYQASNGRYYYTQVFIGATNPRSFVISFPDVPPSHVFFHYIEAICTAGITKGYSNGTYRPNDPVAR